MWTDRRRKSLRRCCTGWERRGHADRDLSIAVLTVLVLGPWLEVKMMEDPVCFCWGGLYLSVFIVLEIQTEIWKYFIYIFKNNSKHHVLIYKHFHEEITVFKTKNSMKSGIVLHLCRSPYCLASWNLAGLSYIQLSYLQSVVMSHDMWALENSTVHLWEKVKKANNTFI